MARYSIALVGVTASAGTIQTGSVGVLKPATTSGAVGSVGAIYEISLSGEATTSTAWRAVVQRATAVTILAASTPAPLHHASPAASSTSDGGNAGVASAATASGNELLLPSFNAFGGVYRWVAPPGSELVTLGITAATNGIVLFSANGSPTVSGHILFEEV